MCVIVVYNYEDNKCLFEVIYKFCSKFLIFLFNVTFWLMVEVDFLDIIDLEVKVYFLLISDLLIVINIEDDF